MDTLTVETRPAVIDSNFAAIRAQLAQHLAEYDDVVTVDTVKEAKSRATELNKLSGEIKSRVKAAVDEVSAPITAFKDQGRELVEMCQATRATILDQVATFESETMKTVCDLLIEYRDQLYGKQDVREEYRRATLSGWAKISWLTTAGNLTSAAKKEVEAAVNECLNLQLRTDNRLSRLENESHRAGLHSPLTREHVEGVLFAPDEQYSAGLAKLIARELERQEETERRAREKVEQEHQEKLEREQREKAEQEAAEAAEQAVEPEPEPVAASAPEPEPEPEAEPEPLPVAAEAEPIARAAKTSSGKRLLNIYVFLEVEVPDQVTYAQVKSQLLGKLRAAGVDSSVQKIDICTAGETEAA